MTTRLQVVAAGRDHDLPPRWDGVAVTWGPWTALLTSMRFHDPLGHACRACGQVDDEPHIATGRPSGADPEPGALRLTAFRCPGCGHDQVLDADGELWDLDESDYIAMGSTVEGVLFL